MMTVPKSWGRWGFFKSKFLYDLFLFVFLMLWKITYHHISSQHHLKFLTCLNTIFNCIGVTLKSLCFLQEHGDARTGSSVPHPLVHPHGSRGHPYSPYYLRNHVCTIWQFNNLTLHRSYVGGWLNFFKSQFVVAKVTGTWITNYQHNQSLIINRSENLLFSKE